MMKRKGWNELSPTQRGAVVLGGVLQLALLLAALRDIRRRPAHEIRGGKRLWTLLSFVNFVGPLAYFLVGRRRSR